jgi:hypothetical protein
MLTSQFRKLGWSTAGCSKSSNTKSANVKKRPALMAAMSTRSSERCPRRRLNALRSSLVR